MNGKEINLSSVNWTQGMFLTPEHFLKQERYFDSALLWAIHYALDGYGLVGSGGRVEPAERGAAKHDPIINVDDDGEAVKVSVSQCRGLSPSGDIIEISPSNAINRSFPRSQIEGHQEVGVYIVCEPHDKVVEDNYEDPANPQVKSIRRQRYGLQLDVTAAEAAHSLMVSRLRKAEGSLRYERVPGFIPVCTTLIGHSELKRAWERLRDQMISLAERYLLLHKAIVEYIAMAAGSYLPTSGDNEVLQFVGRMVMALESSVYEALDPLQSPRQFLQKLYRVVRSASVYLDLSPPTREYFRELAALGLTEFSSMLEQEQQSLLANRELTIHDNLSEDLSRVESAFHRLRRLEEALEGKYLDYRVSTALEALPFFFDRRAEDPALYETQSRPARPQIYGDDLSFVFAPLRLDGRQNFRVVLIRENEAQFDVGESIATIVQINQGAGQGHEPLYPKARRELHDQRNFAVDFRLPPEIHTISDVRVTVNAAYRIRSCLLYRRRLITPGSPRVTPAIPPPPEPPPIVTKLVVAPQETPSGRLSNPSQTGGQTGVQTRGRPEEVTSELPRAVDQDRPKKRRRLE
ncbi:MAG: hypothetical protein J2P21_33950 [Chloracidobacterium sp.]|nr:hypothetical protein [Chloracidobacterium sp.]